MILDFILIFVIVFCVFLGYRKGLSQMILTCIVFLCSIALVTSIYSFLGDSFFSSEQGKELHSTVAGSIEKYLAETEKEVLDNAPYLSIIGLNEKAVHKNEAKSKLSDTIASKSLKAILSVPLVILSFFLLKLAVFIIRKIIKKTTSLPIIHGIDSSLGAICGLLTGIIIAVLLYFVASYIQFIPSFEVIREQFSTSFLVLILNDFIF